MTRVQLLVAIEMNLSLLRRLWRLMLLPGVPKGGRIVLLTYLLKN